MQYHSFFKLETNPLYSFSFYLLQPLTHALEFFNPQISEQQTIPSRAYEHTQSKIALTKG